MRGLALLGVLLINAEWFVGYSNSLTQARLDALPTARIDRLAEYLLDVFVYAKAIGVFAFLFGVGFAMQIDANQPSRGVATLARRYAGLAVIGIVHWLGLWSGDILHVYAIAGFILLGVGRWKTSTLATVGLTLAVVARPIFSRLQLLFPSVHVSVLSPDERLSVFLHGSYLSIVGMQLRNDVLEYLMSGALLAAVVHALGRFMVGVAVARNDYFTRIHAYRPQLSALVLVGLPTGVVAQHDWALLSWLKSNGWLESPQILAFVGHVCNSIGVVSMTIGYVALFLLLWETAALRHILEFFAPAGRMALTNYLAQTILNCVLYWGTGLGLMGRVGVTISTTIAVGFFAFQTAASQWWLARFRYGPIEWLWRWWTYRYRPPLIAVSGP
jgi:uncharacterized protein